MKFNFYTFFGFFLRKLLCGSKLVIVHALARQGVEQREALPKAMEVEAGTAEDPVGL